MPKIPNSEKCSLNIFDDGKAPRCDSCGVFFHLDEKCSGLCASEQRSIVLQKSSMIFFCEDCKTSFKKIPLLINKLAAIESKVNSLEDKVTSIEEKIQTLKTEGSSSLNSDSVSYEIHDRITRASNLMVYNVKESSSTCF
ncbi:unnamed protein product [Psylliodes chrysocephalus]|uniref:Uncharacterized protein n=1 Tax=Psylliodes chrysocephalus TaxID=3402493 RepID=A0A9P0G8J3_9CUCU|nr:unnamed protein product [Psylliodes chrysocephala]